MGAPKGNKFAVGNRGNSSKKEFREALKYVMKSRFGAYEKGLQEIAEQLVSSAFKPHGAWAIIEIINRIDGKPAQSVTVRGEKDAPIISRIERVIVESNGADAQDQDSESLPTTH